MLTKQNLGFATGMVNVTFVMDYFNDPGALNVFCSQCMIDPFDNVGFLVLRLIVSNMIFSILAPNLTPMVYSLCAFFISIGIIKNQISMTCKSTLILTMMVYCCFYWVVCFMHRLQGNTLLYVRTLVILYLAFLHFTLLPEDWIMIRFFVLTMSIKLLDISQYSEEMRVVVYPSTFPGYLLSPASFMNGPIITVEEFLAVCVRPQKKTLTWVRIIAKKLIQAFIFFIISNCILKMIAPDDSHRLLVLYRESLQFRCYFYAMCCVAEAVIVSGGYGSFQSNFPWGFPTVNWTKVESASSLSLTLANWDSNITAMCALFMYPIHMLFNRRRSLFEIVYNTLRLALCAYLFYYQAGIYIVVLSILVMFAQHTLCDSLRYLTGERCSFGCCSFRSPRLIPRPASLLMKIVNIYVVICNHIFLSFLTLDISRWPIVANIFLYNLGLQVALVILVKIVTFVAGLYN